MGTKRGSDAPLRRIVEGVPYGLAYVDEGGRYGVVNEAYAQLIGLPASALIGQPVQHVLGPMAWEMISPYLERAMGGEAQEAIHYALPASEETLVLARYFPHYDGNTQAGVVVHVEARPSDREGGFEFGQGQNAILAAMSEGVVLLASDGTILACNTAAEQILGRSWKQLVGTRSGEVPWQAIDLDGGRIDPETYPHARAARHRENVEREVVGFVKPDGRRRWLSVSCRPLFGDDGSDPGRVIATFRDITDRIETKQRLEQAVQEVCQARDDLAERQGILQSILDTVADAVITIDEHGVMQSVNGVVETMFGHDPETLIGQNVKMLMPEPFRREHDGYVLRFVKTAEPRIIGKGRRLEALHRDGRRIPIHLWVSEARTGGERRFTGVIRDLTRKEALERALRQHQKLEALGSLAAGVAHDFNNILLATQVSLEGLRLGRPELQRDEDVTLALQHLKRGADLVAQVLAFATDKDSEPFRPVSIGVLLTEVEALVRSTLTTGVSVRFPALPEPLIVEGAGADLHRVVVNLCNNAVQAVAAEGGRVTVHVERYEHPEDGDPSLDLGSGPHACLRVSDTGPGVAPEHLDRIFDPFFTTKPLGEGSGMGLAVVHGIVRRHRGAIRVPATVGNGAIFEVFLPLSQRPVEPQSEPQPPRGEGRVMVVDDDPGIARGVSRLLVGLGYESVHAIRGADALKSLAEAPGDFVAVLTDLSMPSMDGRALAAAVLALDPGLPVIVTSGYAPPDLLDEPGVVAVLPKPYSVDDLARMVEKVRRRPRRE